jgi:hypothetical protein
MAPAAITDNGNKGLIGTINSWWMHPFNSQGSAFTWVLFVGIIVIAAFLWNLVLLEFAKEV